jgi:hypothetical protein
MHMKRRPGVDCHASAVFPFPWDYRIRQPDSPHEVRTGDETLANEQDVSVQVNPQLSGMVFKLSSTPAFT